MTDYLSPILIIAGFVANAIVTAVVVGRLLGKLESKLNTTAAMVETNIGRLDTMEKAFQQSEIETASVRGTRIAQVENIQKDVMLMRERMHAFSNALAEISVLRTEVGAIMKTLIRIEDRINRQEK